jgi:hypothetical protein
MVILGVLTVIFFVFAALNGAKRYIKNPLFKKFIKHHKIYGMLASLFALTHLLMALLNDDFRVTGLLALVFVVLTGVLGSLFSKLHNKKLYILHRIFGPVAFVLIIVHIIFNSAF